MAAASGSVNTSAGGGGLIGGIIGSIGGLIEDPLVNAHSARVAFRRQKTIMKNAVRWRMQDLQRAGINPILAAGGLSPQELSPAMQAPSHSADAWSALSNNVTNYMQRRLNQVATAQQISESTSRTGLNDSNALAADFRRKYLLPLEIQEKGENVGLTHSAAALNRQREQSERRMTQLRELELPEARREAEFFRGKGGAIAPWTRLLPLTQGAGKGWLR